jgi:hypothetical protein
LYKLHFHKPFLQIENLLELGTCVQHVGFNNHIVVVALGFNYLASNKILVVPANILVEFT